jgi:hypothetical protein
VQVFDELPKSNVEDEFYRQRPVDTSGRVRTLTLLLAVAPPAPNGNGSASSGGGAQLQPPPRGEDEGHH